VTINEALEWLYSTRLHGIKLGLSNVERLVSELDLPLDRLRFLHVAGTNGKGSVCAMLDSMARAGGLRTGLYTSPHLVRFSERIRINGEPITDDQVAAGLSAIRKLAGNWLQSPTFFEITTTLALWHFSAQPLDLIVLETGMGGRLDATNIVRPLVSVITRIDLDHQQWLGDTVEKIAWEKAGIIKPGVPVVSAMQAPEVEAVLRAEAEQVGSSFTVADQPWMGGPMGLHGDHQRWNAAVAVKALEAAHLKLPEEAMVSGLAQVQWPGRFQVCSNQLVLDGAHNAAAAEQLRATWREQFGEEQCTLVLGVLKDKDLGEIVRALLPIASEVFAVPVRSHRTAAPETITQVVHALDSNVPTREFPDFASAYDEARRSSRKVLVSGSLFLAGEALATVERNRADQPGE
jgi:dihydrofolate synthase/folylpolyglutamate synthase